VATYTPYYIQLDATERCRYDIEVLATQFHVSLEQAWPSLNDLAGEQPSLRLKCTDPSPTWLRLAHRHYPL